VNYLRHARFLPFIGAVLDHAVLEFDRAGSPPSPGLLSGARTIGSVRCEIASVQDDGIPDVFASPGNSAFDGLSVQDASGNFSTQSLPPIAERLNSAGFVVPEASAATLAAIGFAGLLAAATRRRG